MAGMNIQDVFLEKLLINNHCHNPIKCVIMIKNGGKDVKKIIKDDDSFNGSL